MKKALTGTTDDYFYGAIWPWVIWCGCLYDLYLRVSGARKERFSNEQLWRFLLALIMLGSATYLIFVAYSNTWQWWWCTWIIPFSLLAEATYLGRRG